MGVLTKVFGSENRELKRILAEQDARLKKAERRYYETLRANRPVFSPLLNDRNHWQQKPLRDQARHLYQNDPIARRLVDSIVCNMIGKGVSPITQGDEAHTRVVDRFFSHWSYTTEGDFYEDNTLVGMQGLIVRSLVRDGSVFVRRVFRKRKLSLQILEGDYLNVKLNGKDKKHGNEIVNGIEFTSDGKVTAYHLYVNHPDNFNATSLNTGAGEFLDTVRIPQKDICHLKKLDRSGQHDGFSWLAPALTKLWDLKEYEDAKLKQQKLQACFTAFVQDNFEMSEEEREDIIGNLDDYGSDARAIEPGYVEELPPGKTITFPSATGVSGEGFVERCLRQIAGALGLSYEIFNDYSQVNFSSGRMGFLEMNRHLRHVLESCIVPQCFLRIGEWVLTHLEMNDLLPSDHGVTIRWSPEAPVMIDPDKEIRSIQAMVGSNFISMKEAVSLLGYDFDKVLAEIKSSNEKMDKYGVSGLTFAQGGAQSREHISKTFQVPIDNSVESSDYEDIMTSTAEAEVDQKEAEADKAKEEAKATDAGIDQEKSNDI